MKVVGRLAAQISKILQGKDKPLYAPNKDLGDVCIVVNASQIELTGKKWDQKVYRWHTGKSISLPGVSRFLGCIRASHRAYFPA